MSAISVQTCPSRMRSNSSKTGTKISPRLREGPPHMVRGYSLGEMINRGFVELDLVRVEPHAGRVSLMIMSWNNLGNCRSHRS